MKGKGKDEGKDREKQVRKGGKKKEGRKIYGERKAGDIGVRMSVHFSFLIFLFSLLRGNL